MSLSSQNFSRYFFIFSVSSPLIFIIILTITVVFPALRDPESLMYGSSIGYPSIKRLIGQPIKVETATVQTQNLETGLSATGETVALQNVDIYPLVSGTVQNVYVKEGELVRKGDRLIQIDVRPYMENLNKIRNQLSEVENEVSYQPQLHQDNLVSIRANIKSYQEKVNADAKNIKLLPQKNKDLLQRLQSNVNIAKQQVDIAKRKLDKMNFLRTEGGFSSAALADTEQDYVQRKKELVDAQQKLTQERKSTQLELNDYRKNYSENQRLLTDAKQSLSQAKSEYRKNVEQSKIRLKNTKIELEKAVRLFNQTVIYASTNGLVSKVNINRGEVADTGNNVLTLNQNIVFKAYIDQARTNSVKVGDTAQVYLVAYPGKVFEGRVTQVNPTVETNIQPAAKVGINRQYTYSAWIKIDVADMPPGLQGYVEFKQSKNRVTIPENAVTHLSAGEAIVMLLENGRGILREVKVGQRINNQREIVSGLKIGEEVVLSPRALNPGDFLKQN
ncbi:MAG: HlyD family efflux transporter periplasmic adaptor subunit [Sphaerospermopsis sp. SIO1G2]|nr:HlyD family efflux transporter periplasmic adaptor subunit [Sphaerospermopsis sp. SIO1G2]